MEDGKQEIQREQKRIKEGGGNEVMKMAKKKRERKPVRHTRCSWRSYPLVMFEIFSFTWMRWMMFFLLFVKLCWIKYFNRLQYYIRTTHTQHAQIWKGREGLNEQFLTRTTGNSNNRSVSRDEISFDYSSIFCHSSSLSSSCYRLLYLSLWIRLSCLNMACRCQSLIISIWLYWACVHFYAKLLINPLLSEMLAFSMHWNARALPPTLLLSKIVKYRMLVFLMHIHPLLTTPLIVMLFDKLI